LVNLLQTYIETLLFYHPAVWWVSEWIRQEREHCCDDMALAACGDRVAYARALAIMEQLRSRPVPFVAAASGGSLLERIRRIAAQPESTPVMPGVIIPVTWGALLVTMICAARSSVSDERGSRNGELIALNNQQLPHPDIVGTVLSTDGEPVPNVEVVAYHG